MRRRFDIVNISFFNISVSRYSSSGLTICTGLPGSASFGFSIVYSSNSLTGSRVGIVKMNGDNLVLYLSGNYTVDICHTYLC